jgi:hypothetical protein
MHKLKLVKVGKHKIQVVKLIRMFTQLGLKESKELMDNAPSILISHRVDISLEQIIKNFAAIGAIVEKVQEEKKNKPKDEAIGPDEFYSTDRPGIAKQEIKDYQKVNIKTKTVKTYNSDYQKVENKKLNLKPAIFFATIVAVIKSFANLYFGYYATFYAIFIVAIGIAYFLRKYNPDADKKIGIPAFLITLSYFFAIRVIDAIILYILYQYAVPLNIFGLFISLFTSGNFLVLLAAIMAYFLVMNKFIFKRFYKKLDKTKSEDNDFMENKQIKYRKEKKRF